MLFTSSDTMSLQKALPTLFVRTSICLLLAAAL